MLEEALAQERARTQQLAQQLAQKRAQAEKVTRSIERTQGRTIAKVKVLASQGGAAWLGTTEQIRGLAQDLRRQDELDRRWYRVQGQVQTSSQALERAQSNVQALERALALAMAQARTLARAQAQARSPRLRAIAFIRFLWQLMQAPSGLWSGIVRNLYLGMGVVALGAWMLPAAGRARWKQEAYSELEDLKQEAAPLLGNAIRIALRIPWLALVLWTQALGRPTAGWLARRKPLWIGLGAAVAVFLAGAAGIRQSPTDRQMRLLLAASLLAGVVAASQTSRGRRPRRRRRKRRM
jgi:hypothetical protein